MWSVDVKEKLFQDFLFMQAVFVNNFNSVNLTHSSIWAILPKTKVLGEVVTLNLFFLYGGIRNKKLDRFNFRFGLPFNNDFQKSSLSFPWNSALGKHMVLILDGNSEYITHVGKK